LREADRNRNEERKRKKVGDMTMRFRMVERGDWFWSVRKYGRAMKHHCWGAGQALVELGCTTVQAFFAGRTAWANATR
jgi:hypothetical protein